MHHFQNCKILAAKVGLCIAQALDVVFAVGFYWRFAIRPDFSALFFYVPTFLSLDPALTDDVTCMNLE